MYELFHHDCARVILHDDDLHDHGDGGRGCDHDDDYDENAPVCSFFSYFFSYAHALRLPPTPFMH